MSIDLNPITSTIPSPGTSAVFRPRVEFYGEGDGITCSLLEAILGIPFEASLDRTASKVLAYDRFAAIPWIVGVGFLATALLVGA